MKSKKLINFLKTYSSCFPIKVKFSSKIYMKIILIMKGIYVEIYYFSSLNMEEANFVDSRLFHLF